MSDDFLPDVVSSRLYHLLQEIYAGSGLAVEEILRKFIRVITHYRDERPERLRALDATTARDWFKSPDNIVYVLYPDLFNPQAPNGSKLRAMREDIPYLRDLGINLIHILPIFKSSGDCGFAVDDYKALSDAVGSIDDLKALIDTLHASGMRVILDFVLNHVSNSHLWAKAAVDGLDPQHERYRDFFIWDKSGDCWEGVRDVFPDFSPGHWDYVPELQEWVWATFYKRYPKKKKAQIDFAQWDLNYRNPEVLLEMLDCLLNSANWGVDVFRLDAIPHLWKERGTDCRSLPKVHTIIKLLALCLQFVAPRSVLLAEANDTPARLARYFAEGDGVHLAYHFPLMTALWNAVITGEGECIRKVLSRRDEDSHGHWLIFSESHDELSLSKAGDMANEVYTYCCQSGCLSFGGAGRGVCGTTFSMLRGDFRKIQLLWQLKLSLGWTPMFYMGEELGLRNDMGYLDDPARCKDSRFCKRVPMSAKERRNQDGSVESFLFNRLAELLRWRKAHPCLASAPDFFDTGSTSVLGFSKKRAEDERLLILANCSDIRRIAKVAGFEDQMLEPFEFKSIKTKS